MGPPTGSITPGPATKGSFTPGPASTTNLVAAATTTPAGAAGVAATDFVILCHVILDPQICAVNSDGRIELPNALVKDFIIHFTKGSSSAVVDHEMHGWNRFKNAMRFRKSQQVSSSSLLGRRMSSSVASRSDDVIIFWV